MCGLFGVIAPLGRGLGAGDRKRFVRLGTIAQRRGSDASGIVTVRADGRIEVVKSDLPFSGLTSSPVAQRLLDRMGDGFAVLGHSRLETHGFSATSVNNQPVIVGDWVVLHNGIITNHRQLREKYPTPDLTGIDSDTAAIGLVLSDWDAGGRATPVDEVFAQLEGEYTVIAMSTRGDVLLHTNVGNLYTVRDDDGFLLLASEPRQFDERERARCVRLPLHETVVVRETGSLTGRITVTEAEASKARGFTGAQGLHLDVDGVDGAFSRRVAAVADAALERAAGLARCRTCVLPVTFPGLELDGSGQCSVCRTYTPPVYPGQDALVEELRRTSPDGRRVLVCLSGGRDSCYVLHLVCELGFEPIAYTYDWGMVTTAARENMARMCGALGVEHILVSPNIRKNRLRIRRALRAWLAKPEVSTIPILMAGDKPYFRFAAKVADERGGLPAVMADHPLETTGFKSMLAGARPTTSETGGVSYRLDRKSLARMIGSYGLHAVRAPGLFPSLFAEGAVGFVDYYLRHHSFVRPFSFTQWDEEELETTLRGTYGWSAGEDRSSASWRMGDGTAPFYNLIYLLALGMSEHDALRSNQVRAGLITREEALQRIMVDNRVNPLGLASYFATVNLDSDWALGRIERYARTVG